MNKPTIEQDKLNNTNSEAKTETPAKPNDTGTSVTPESTATTDKPTEHGGQKGLEPTRYGDWEKNGRCTDF